MGGIHAGKYQKINDCDLGKNEAICLYGMSNMCVYRKDNIFPINSSAYNKAENIYANNNFRVYNSVMCLGMF